MLPVLWVASAVAVVVCAVRSRRHPGALLKGRLATAFLYLVAGAGVNVAMLLRGDDYARFADGAYLGFVTDTWREVVVPNHHAWIALLIAFELTVGVLVLLGGRATQLAYVAAIGFHIALLSFGWGFYAWSLPMAAALATLLVGERRTPQPSPRRARGAGPSRPGQLTRTG